jgi:hypothetical protein
MQQEYRGYELSGNSLHKSIWYNMFANITVFSHNQLLLKGLGSLSLQWHLSEEGVGSKQVTRCGHSY